MTLGKKLFILCLASSAICLVVGHAMAGGLLGACMTLPPCAAMFFRRKSAWDLANLERSMAGTSTRHEGAAVQGTSTPRECAAVQGSGMARAKMRYEKRHARFLACALGAGLLGAAGALLLPLRLSFIVMFLLVVLDLFCLERVACYLSAGREGHTPI
jgi:hypothetical protein